MINQHAIFEQTVTGLGFDLIEVERLSAGLLRVTIDHPYNPDASEVFITAEDCERVTRQLQYVLEVEGVDYKRLEVSSPGIDRPLRHEADLTRFVGQVIDITLRDAVGQAGQAADSGIAANRKKFRGSLGQTDAGWQVVWQEEVKPLKPGAKVSKAKQAAAPVHALGFVWSEIREARLAPIVNFKGRGQ